MNQKELLLWIEGPTGPVNHAAFERDSDLYDFLDAYTFPEGTHVWNYTPKNNLWYHNFNATEGEISEVHSDCLYVYATYMVPPEIRARALLLS